MSIAKHPWIGNPGTGTLRAGLLLLALVLLVPGGETLAQRSERGAPYASEKDLIEVMFAAESRVRMRDAGLVDLSTDALAGLDAALADAGEYSWSRICDVEEEVLDRLQTEGESKSGEPLYNLNNIYRLRFATGAGAPDVWTLSERLEALPGIQTARPCRWRCRHRPTTSPPRATCIPPAVRRPASMLNTPGR